MDRPPGVSPDHASAFQESTVVAAYDFRPPYPPSTFDLLLELLPAAGRALDVGCGTGNVARHLAARGVEVDAVDISAAMVEHGRRLPYGTHPRLHWHVSRIDEAPLTPPYDLITAGESLHWLEWADVLPLFGRLLTDEGSLVILEIDADAVPWRAELRPVISRYSTNRNFMPMDLSTELTKRGLFVESGRTATPQWTFRQPLDDYVESFHGRASFSRQRMDPAAARSFDEEVRAAVGRREADEVALPVVATLVWGRPAVPPPASAGGDLPLP